MDRFAGLISIALLAGCAQAGLDGPQPAEEADQVEISEASEPELLSPEGRREIAVYTLLAAMSCETAQMYRQSQQMGIDPKIARPKAKDASEFTAAHDAAAGFLGLQESIRSFRAAEIECFSKPTDQAVATLTSRRSEVTMNLELVSGIGPRVVQKTLSQLEEDLKEYKRKIAAGEVPDDFVAEAVIASLEDDIKQATAEQSYK